MFDIRELVNFAFKLEIIKSNKRSQLVRKITFINDQIYNISFLMIINKNLEKYAPLMIYLICYLY